MNSKKVKVKCGEGKYLKNKGSDHETCKWCPAGKFSNARLKRNKRCKKCPRNSYAYSQGSGKCLECPDGFDTKGRKGKKQCFLKRTATNKKRTGMKKLGFFDTF